MQQINSNLALVQAQQKCHMPMSSEDKREEPLSDLTVKMVLGLFTRMAELFRNKARSEGLIIYFDEEKEIYSDTFKLWCVKLKDLTIEDFRDGTLAMEQMAEALYKSGEQMWPPSFAEFRALCFPSVDFDKQAHRMLPSLWDPIAMCYRLEDQTAKEKRYKLGQKKSGELLQLLGEKPEAVVEPETAAQAKAFAQIRLEQAKQLLAKKQGA